MINRLELGTIADTYDNRLLWQAIYNWPVVTLITCARYAMLYQASWRLDSSEMSTSDQFMLEPHAVRNSDPGVQLVSKEKQLPRKSNSGWYPKHARSLDSDLSTGDYSRHHISGTREKTNVRNQATLQRGEDADRRIWHLCKCCPKLSIPQRQSLLRL